MIEDSENEPIQPERWEPLELGVICPRCDEATLCFNVNMEEDADGSWHVDESRRYRRCDGCDALLDLGGLSFQAVPR